MESELSGIYNKEDMIYLGFSIVLISKSEKIVNAWRCTIDRDQTSDHG